MSRDPRLHPQALAALVEAEDLDPLATVPDDEIAEVREEQREAGLAEPKEPVHEVRDLEVGGVPCRLHRPSAGTLPVVLYLHGGGFVLGDLETHDAQARRLANRTGWAVLAADYRRPPEHRFPAALDDSVAALDGLLTDADALGLDPARVVVAGDSAGGNLAVGVARRRPGTLAGALLVYPFLDPETASASYSSLDGGLDRADARWFWDHYAPDGVDRADPDLAPLRATDLGSLPPTLVQVAECDTLADEVEAFVRLARSQGAQVEDTLHAGMIHGFWRRPAEFDAAEVALDEAARWLARLG
ncbi:alpha/beta hydrolase [Nocardioides marmoribigeumensis]|uniref:Acetyl esterase n=1 Tax=Nocardioides marmoribigeumensis TaxID=433649 RepID=A0ABU2C0K8_9ACTN|nr:alpha/beta hydrolase [Nocardioides marmoribigeumensis]MDR7364207.1 acetyl esterase [Nocardioides marmoribigeumensis]